MAQAAAETPKNPLREIVQPFIDLVHAPRALWGVNLGYLLEGFVYFGMLGYLAMYFSDFVFRGVPNADEWAHPMVGFLTAGITISMFFLGFVPDRFGVRRGLLLAFACLFVGRVIVAGAPDLGLAPGLWGPLHLATMLGLFLVIVGYGMYQPSAYAAVRQFTTPKTAAMGFAMLYALMNLGGWLPSFMFLVRDEEYLGLGIHGAYWVYAGLTLVALVSTAVILTPRVVREAIERAKRETAEIEAQEQQEREEAGEAAPANLSDRNVGREAVPIHLWLSLAVLLAVGFWFLPLPWAAGVAVVVIGSLFHPRVRHWLANHPFSDAKFFVFIFSLIPVQTLFTYNWLILPQYIHRAYEGWIGQKFEVAANFNPLLIFILVPIVTAMTQKAKVYNMMILGTAVMAAPAFFLALGTNALTLFAYLVVMTVGEAMWQPRFLQYAAEIAPEGKTGIYMGVAQFPWFLTKMLVPFYSGWFMQHFCPAEGPRHPEQMWFWFGVIAITSPALLLALKGWLGKDFKSRA